MLLDRYFKDPSLNEHLHPEQLDVNGDCIFHHIAKAKFSSQVLKLTEMLCENGKISADYRNKENRLPSQYITKKNDRRLQYFKMAQSVQRSREQFCEATPAKKMDESDTKDEMDEFYYMQRPADSQTSPKSGPVEVVKMESEREERKKHIEELIKLLPDSKHSIFNVDHSKNRQPYVQNKTTESEMNNSEIEPVPDKMSEIPKEAKDQNESVKKDSKTFEVKNTNLIDKVLDIDLDESKDFNSARTKVDHDTELNGNVYTTSTLDESMEDEFVDAVEDIGEIDIKTGKNLTRECCEVETSSVANDELQEITTSNNETAAYLNHNENQAEVIHIHNRKDIAHHDLQVEEGNASENLVETKERPYKVANDVSETANEGILLYSRKENNGVSVENRNNNASVDQDVTFVIGPCNDNVVATEDVKKATDDVDGDGDFNCDVIDDGVDDNDFVEEDEEDDEEEDQEIDVQVSNSSYTIFDIIVKKIFY